MAPTPTSSTPLLTPSTSRSSSRNRATTTRTSRPSTTTLTDREPKPKPSTSSTSDHKSVSAPRFVLRIKDKMLPSSPRRRFMTGVGLLLCVVVLWTTSNFITSDLLEGGYNKPFLITYLNTSAFSLYLIPFLFKRWNARRRLGQADRSHEYIPIPHPPADFHSRHPSHSHSQSHSRPPSTLATRTLGVRRSNSLIRSLSPSPALITHSHPHPHSSSHQHAHGHGHGNGSGLSPLPQRREVDDFGLRGGSDISGSALENDPDGEVDDYSEHEHEHAYNDDEDEDVHLQPISSQPSSGLGEDRLTSLETARLAAAFCIVWFAANWTVNASLGLTSVGSSTVLAGMSGFFTLALGRVFGVESFTRAKVLAVLASFFGLVLVTHSDSLLASVSSNSLPDPTAHVKRPMWGDALALLSAFCYAIYVILLKVRIGDEERVDMQLFFGFVGLFNTLFLLPLIPILSAAGIETFEFPTRKQDLIVCAVNMVITLSSDYLYVLAMLKTTPLVVTIGLSLTIPFAMLGDFLRGSTDALTSQSILGACLVIVGFGLMGLEGLERDETARIVAVEVHHDEHDEESGVDGAGDIERGRSGTRTSV